MSILVTTNVILFIGVLHDFDLTIRSGSGLVGTLGIIFLGIFSGLYSFRLPTLRARAKKLQCCAEAQCKALAETETTYMQAVATKQQRYRVAAPREPASLEDKRAECERLLEEANAAQTALAEEEARLVQKTIRRDRKVAN